MKQYRQSLGSITLVATALLGINFPNALADDAKTNTPNTPSCQPNSYIKP